MGASVTYKNHILSRLTPDDAAAIAPQLSSLSLASGQILFEPGDVPTSVYFPESGIVSVVTVMRDGRSVEAATIGNESVAGSLAALSQAPLHARYFIQVPGLAWRLPAAALRQQARRSEHLNALLLARVQKDVALAEQSLACNALHTATQRLARWLLLSEDRVGAPMVRLTQEFLAIMLGVQRTTVTITASALRSAGLIRYARGVIEILDRAGLERAACECYCAEGELAAGVPDRARSLRSATTV